MQKSLTLPKFCEFLRNSDIWGLRIGTIRRVMKSNNFYLQEGPRLVCQRRSEVVYFSGILEAILKRLKIVFYLSSCLVHKSKLVRYCAQARATRKCFHRIIHCSHGFLRKKAARVARKMFQYVIICTKCYIFLMKFLREGLLKMIQATRNCQLVRLSENFSKPS